MCLREASRPPSQKRTHTKSSPPGLQRSRDHPGQEGLGWGDPCPVPPPPWESCPTDGFMQRCFSVVGPRTGKNTPVSSCVGNNSCQWEEARLALSFIGSVRKSLSLGFMGQPREPPSAVVPPKQVQAEKCAGGLVASPVAGCPSRPPFSVGVCLAAGAAISCSRFTGPSRKRQI